MLLKHGKTSLLFALRLRRGLAGADQYVPLGFGKVGLAPMAEICGALFAGELAAAIVVGEE